MFYDQHGYEYKIFTKMLAPTLMLDWQQTTRLCEMLVLRKDGHIFDRIPIVDLAHLKDYIDSFTSQATPLQKG